MGRLKKGLRTIDIFSIASGAMISSGLFVLPAVAYAKVGSSVFISYILAAIFMLPALFSKAELITAMPKAGGPYYFVERGLGAFFGTITGISLWFLLVLKSSFALIGIGIFINLFFPSLLGLQIKLIAILFSLIFVFLNLFSLKSFERSQTILVMAVLFILTFYILKGLPKVNFSNFSLPGIGDMKKVFSTAGLVLIAYTGFTKVASVAEETQNPERTIPKGMILSFSIVSLIYILSISVTIGLVKGTIFMNSLTPISEGAKTLMGSVGNFMVFVSAIIAFVSTANSGILAASRILMAMSRDEILPEIFRKSSKKGLPHISIIFTGLSIIFMILFLDIERLAEMGSILIIISSSLIILSLILMRGGKFLSYKPRFKAPVFPWLYIVSLFLYLFLILIMGKESILITFLFISTCTLWYFIYVKKRVNRKSAMIHALEKLSGIKLKPSTLEKELRKIVVEMDNLPQDKIFDAVHHGVFLDLPYSTDMEEFLTKLAISLKDRIKNVDFISLRKELYRIFREKKIFSHFLFSFLEVPFEGVFEIIGVRCKRGFKFFKEREIVGIIIVIYSKENKEIALCALAELLSIAEDEKFLYEWIMAKDEEELKSIIIFSERRGRSCIVY